MSQSRNTPPRNPDRLHPSTTACSGAVLSPVISSLTQQRKSRCSVKADWISSLETRRSWGRFCCSPAFRMKPRHGGPLTLENRPAGSSADGANCGEASSRQPYGSGCRNRRMRQRDPDTLRAFAAGATPHGKQTNTGGRGFQRWWFVPITQGARPMVTEPRLLLSRYTSCFPSLRMARRTLALPHCIAEVL